jgi:hypothetical protein
LVIGHLDCQFVDHLKMLPIQREQSEAILNGSGSYERIENVKAV